MEPRRFAAYAWVAVGIVIVGGIIYAFIAANEEKQRILMRQLTIDEPAPMVRFGEENPILTDTRIESELNTKLDPNAQVLTQKPLPEKPTPYVRTCPATDPEAPDLTLFPISPTMGIGPARPSGLFPIAAEFSLSGGFYCLGPDAHSQFETMARAARKDGVLLIVVSAYRSSARQAELQTIGETDNDNHTSVALPGHSEHQLGNAIDLTSGTVPIFTHYRFAESSEYIWLQTHAAEYGFVQSYRPGDEDVTGYIAEPWHWRYIGIDTAADYHAQDKPLVQYLTDLATISTDEKKQDRGN